MKTKILLFLSILCGIYGYSQQNESYYELQGRPEGKKALTKLAEATNNSIFPVHFISDNTTGIKYELTLFHKGKRKYSNSFNVSNILLTKLNKHVDKPGAGEQILGLCVNQAAAMQKVFREGLNLNLDMLNSDCKCPPEEEIHVDQKPEIMRTLYVQSGNYNSNIGGMNTKPYDFGFNQNDQKTKTWFGRNWGWVVPLGLAIIGGTIYLTNNSSTTFDNNPDGPGHNDNARDFKGLAQPTGGFVIHLGG